MPQIITKRNTTSGQVIGPTVGVVIPGMSASLLTGSGSILITFMATFRNTYAGANTLFIYPRVDGIEITDARAVVVLPENAYQHFLRSVVIRPGAGQHVFDLIAFEAQTALNIEDHTGALIVHELGY